MAYAIPLESSISIGELAAMFGIQPNLLYLLANKTPKFYHIYKIPKKNGGFRTIEEPCWLLKRIQRIIVDDILSANVHFIARAFEPGCSIVQNASIHCGQTVILGLDLKDFFPSTSYRRVRQFYRRCGFSQSICTILAKLCTLYGHLPQGAVTSPRLSNLLLRHFDRNLYRYCAKQNIAVSRYADDITFSGHLDEDRINDLIQYCRVKLGRLHLQINDKKTRVLRQSDQQKVTGLVVNDKVAAPRALRRSLRQTMHYLTKYNEYERRPIDKHTLHKLLGQVNFVWDVDRDNVEFAEYRQRLMAMIRMNDE